VHVECRDGVGWIVLDHPPLNVITTSMTRAMRAAVEAFDDDPAARIIVLTAAGECAFAAGADVGEHTREKVRELNDELFALARTLIRADGKPRLAAVKGICSGGANEVAFACDIVVAREDTRFALPEIGIGAVGALGALMMARFMSPGKALELGLGGEWMDAAEAQTFGLVAQVLPSAGFDTALAAFLDKRKPVWRHR
jgi:enoyl-CoA hydratase/carnithine racemase